jgi:hypothetical protein
MYRPRIRFSQFRLSFSSSRGLENEFRRIILSVVAAVACGNVIKENSSLKHNERRKLCKKWLLEKQKFSHIYLLTELKFENKIGLIIYV